MEFAAAGSPHFALRSSITKGVTRAAPESRHGITRSQIEEFL
jgi:hypothetical protein